MKKIFLVISFCSVIFIFDNPLYASVNVNFAEYVPLHVGNSWTLVDENKFNNIYYYQYSVIGTECVNGINTYQYTDWEGNPIYANLTYENGALVVAGLNGGTFDPPRIYDGQDLDNPFVHIVYEFALPLVTAAGIFEDVIKETIYQKIEGQELITRIQYFAKGVGLVKDENWCASCGGTYEFTALLSSYVVAGLPGSDLGTCISSSSISLTPIYLLLKQ